VLNMTGAYLLLLGSLLLIAAVAKFRAPALFHANLGKLLPAMVARPLSVLVPAVELVLGLLLVTGIAARHSLVTSLVLLLAFTVALAEMSRRGLKTCGCFGDDDESATPRSGIIRNLLLVAAGLITLRYGGDFRSLAPDLGTALGRVTVAAGAACLWQGALALIARRDYLRLPRSG
jgi:Methylamine utilisation protein MauE